MEPGTGKLFVKRDGTVLSFDSNKCYKNMIELGRIPRTTTWTRAAAREKAIAKGAAEAAAKPKEEAPAGKKAKKAKKEPEKKAEAKEEASETQE